MKWPVWALAGLWLGLGILGGCGESPKAEAAPKDAAVPGPTSKEGWLTSYSQAVSRAKAENKNILMDFKCLLYLQPDLQAYCKSKRQDSVAQPVEHYTFNVGVLGSNPSGITE